MGEEETFREIISTSRNVSMDYKLPGRETLQGALVNKCFENHIKNEFERLLNGADIYGL